MQTTLPYSSSTPSLSTSMKIKTLVKNFFFSQLSSVTRALAKAKSVIIEIVEETNLNDIQILVPLLFKKKRNKNKLYLGSLRFHYNWGSSRLVPQSSIRDGFSGYLYCEEVDPELHLSGYLHWLEDKSDDAVEIIEINEIDELAENFIASCHGKFLLEKQESERKFQEMMARSV